MPPPTSLSHLVASPVRRVFAATFAATLVLVPPARAEILATFHSPHGDFPAFRVALDAVGQPHAVANFMGLADGSRPWVDPVSGLPKGGGGNAFYGGMVFDWRGNDVVRGGSRAVEDENGNVRYTGGPGYTVLGKTNEVWTPFEWGSLALVEDDGPHSGSGELALCLTNGTTHWTVFGQVVAGDEEGLRKLAECVAADVTDATCAIDAGGATDEETAALEVARAALPVAAGLAVRVSKDGTGAAFDWPPKTRLVLAGGEDLTKGPAWLGAGWHERPESMAVDLAWKNLGLAGTRGFLALAGVEYPAWSGAVFSSGKWRMAMEHTGKQLQYWFDFDAKTGMVAVVEGGKITTRAAFSQIDSWRETGNSVGVYFGQGLMGNFYYLGFACTGAMEGRFMSKQMSIVGETSRDWGTFRLSEGWEDTPSSSPRLSTGGRRSSPPSRAAFDPRWIPWGDAQCDWTEEAILLPDGERLKTVQPGTF